MKRIFAVIAVALLGLGAVYAQGIDAVTAGKWSASADKYSKAIPDGELAVTTVNGKPAITVTFDVTPDVDNGGKDYTWGDLTMVLDGVTKGIDMSKVTAISITYSSNAKFIFQARMMKPVPDEGGEHGKTLPDTKGVIKTEKLAFKDFRQPSWAKAVRLNTKSLKEFAFATDWPRGFKGTLTVYSLVFEGLTAADIK